MRRFLITSPKFTGTAEIYYNAQGILCKIDLSHTDCDETTVTAFKRAVPANVANLQQSFSTDTIVVEADYEVTFEMFWNKYDYKVERKRTLALWDKLSKTNQVKAFFATDAYLRFLKRKPLEKKYPDTFLRTEAFDTEWDKIR